MQPPNTPPPVMLPNEEKQARTWNMLCHLSALSGFVIPFGNFLGPLIIWQIKKHEIPSVVVHGKEALNFQITLFIAMLATAIAMMVLMFIFVGVLLIPVLIGLGIAGIVFPIIAGIKANDGIDYRYPWILRLVQ